MKLWTLKEKLLAKKYPLYSQDGLGLDAKVIVKFFNPYGAGTWIITEAEEQEDGDIMLYGYHHLFEWEWGYILLSQLAELSFKVGNIKLGGIERDLYIPDNARVKDII